jgi:hypothetical protein
LGGVEVFSTTVQTTAANAVTTTASRTYGVQFDSSDRLVVNVPWTAGGTGTVTGVTGTAPIASSGGTAPAISISAATTSAAGSMSAADKTKLDGIASGATANTGTVTSVSVTTANGVSGTVATSTTTPAITLTLGAITPSSVVASGNVTAFSDERLKTNWRNVSEGFVSNLAGLKSGIYDRVDIAETQAGVGAQSLQKFLPEVVVEDQEGTLSVNYGAAAMISAVELAKELVLLRAELAALQLQLVAQQGSGE